MEREVGEVFVYQGKSLQVTKGNDGRCEDCFFEQICARDSDVILLDYVMKMYARMEIVCILKK